MIEFEHLYSISEPYKVFETGKKPVLITCNNTKDYVCKHNFAQSNILFNEYLASAFLKIWSVPTPKNCFINVKNEHIDNYAIENELQPYWFRKTCFGSYYMLYTKELDFFFPYIKQNYLSRINKFDFLKIAIFDLWAANEDRNARNTNLLIDPESMDFFPIDHDLIFNSNSGQDLCQINEEETILAHELFKLLFRKRNSNHKEIITVIIDEFYNFVNECKNNIDSILNKVPTDWEIDINIKKEFLLKNLFSEKWINDTKKNFQYFYYKWIK